MSVIVWEVRRVRGGHAAVGPCRSVSVTVLDSLLLRWPGDPGSIW